MSAFQQMARQIYNAETYSLTGKIENIVGMSIEASGGHAAVGDICRIYNGESGHQVTAEVVGFKNDRILLMPYSDMTGISAGNFVRNTGTQLTLRVGEFLRGRIINALGQPIDGKEAFEGGTPVLSDLISIRSSAHPSASAWNSASKPLTGSTPSVKASVSESLPVPASEKVP